MYSAFALGANISYDWGWTVSSSKTVFFGGHCFVTALSDLWLSFLKWHMGKKRSVDMVVTVSVELSMIAAPKWHCWISAITPSVRVHIAHIVLFEHFSFFLYSKQHGRHCSCLVTLCPPSSSTSRMVHSLATPSSQVKGTE